jgi:hypothetical protein
MVRIIGGSTYSSRVQVTAVALQVPARRLQLRGAHKSCLVCAFLGRPIIRIITKNVWYIKMIGFLSTIGT